MEIFVGKINLCQINVLFSFYVVATLSLLVVFWDIWDIQRRQSPTQDWRGWGYLINMNWNFKIKAMGFLLSKLIGGADFSPE